MNGRGPNFKFSGLTHGSLHILAMLLMLCDHLGAVVFADKRWLRYIGRLSFPIFCFLLVEGFYHTHDRKRYLLRLGFFGLISEIPFDMGLIGYATFKAQNVMWTFLLGLTCLIILDEIKTNCKFKKMTKVILSLGGVLLFCIWADICKTDYAAAGILQIVLFYYLRLQEDKWDWVRVLLQVFGLYLVNSVVLGGLYKTYDIFGLTIKIHIQDYAIFGLLFIWLYNGQKGCNGKWFKWFCYLFYPGHLLMFYLMR